MSTPGVRGSRGGAGGGDVARRGHRGAGPNVAKDGGGAGALVHRRGMEGGGRSRCRRSRARSPRGTLTRVSGRRFG